MSERVQPVGPPTSREEVLAWLDGGQLVDMAGRPLRMTACTRCGGAHLGGEPCHKDVRCPQADCRSMARKCRRPSEHESFSGWHKARQVAFEAECQRRVDAGDDTLPARWPQSASTSKSAISRAQCDALGDPRLTDELPAFAAELDVDGAALLAGRLDQPCRTRTCT